MKLRAAPLLLALFLLAGCAAITPAAPAAPPPAPVVSPASPTRAPVEAPQAEAAKALQYSEVSFDDLAPAGMQMGQCWNGMGMDDRGRVYIGFTSWRKDGREDFPVFRYDPQSRKREFLGSLLDVVKAAGNDRAGEGIPKGHTRIIFADGKMYLGSQSFHDLKQGIESLPTYRGSHLFAFDTTTGHWQDLSAGLPGGVVTQHEGIVALNILRHEHLLVGLAHPSSDIILYDYRANKLAKVVPGIPWKLGNPLSREIVIAKSGNIYTYRGTEEVEQRAETHRPWVYNPRTGEMKDSGFQMTDGFWIGQTQTRDGSKVYLNTTGGHLYAFNTAAETFTDLGYELLPGDNRIIDNTYAVQLSPDEKRLYYIVSVIEKPGGTPYTGSGGSGELYYHDLATGQKAFVQQLPTGVYTSADLRDEENVYFSHFGTPANIWSGKPALFILRVAPSVAPASRTN
jgi:hypothetical protein